MTEDWRNGGFGLYLHWPFCEAKCPYCDFNSHVSRTIDQTRWRDAYLSEIERVSSETDGRVLNSVFFGGGTPSLMSPDLVGSILEKIRSSWPIANDLEVTMEANPSSVEAGRFAGYRDAGVNRVSVGVQALNDRDLRRLGRLHSTEEARRAIEIAQQTFDRMSFDLIYARQDQTLEDWSRELTEALGMAAGHLSLYQLTVEPDTVFGKRHALGHLKGLPDEDLSADLYELTQDITEAAGYPAYEISNHAMPGHGSAHNLIYWRYGDFAGIGPGAHGRLTLNGQRVATSTQLLPGAWLSAVDDGLGELQRTVLGHDDAASEYALMSMRLTEGMSLNRFRTLSGRELDPDAIDELQELGLIWTRAEQIGATRSGRAVLNAILAKLL
ncbi:radical SAM family heme chaperone HemW [Poseidonocella sedimentorum]|uniref:Heme chaperone HemW n=1 Tax=Poseidonocella sedimentorum TaxID=871652 RepID=A0A1I6D6F5_9RHOB|nr:radical SAM family heme chaperone HemW [Poseidonocella sedimentorum]SFR01038.1 oxygen-independent coproporphyrinogen-3 oxidase [Poseidonocella sedimentorum]